MDSAEWMAFMAYRLIPLDNEPGVCPIGVGDVPKKITAKAISFMLLAMTFSCQLELFKHMLVLKLLLILCYEGPIFEDNNTHACSSPC